MSHLPLGDRREAPWYGRDILSVDQFGPDDLELLFAVSREMRQIVQSVGSTELLRGRLLANLFYEPSTRTSSSFMAAMQRLGGQVIPISSVQYSSVSKGEILSDTVRTLESYADVIVIRHPEEGSAAEAAEAAACPVINAGDGIGEHPTQALLDLFTIRDELDPSGQLRPLRDLEINVTMIGDLKNGRTVHSLARLLSKYPGCRLRYVAPEPLQMPRELVSQLGQLGVVQTEHTELSDVIGATDVLYTTRVQKERFANPADYAAVAGSYVVDMQVMAAAPDHMVLMHPLPRVDEIALSVDADPRAAYFRQMRNGMYVRMALLAMVLGRA